MTDSFSLLKNFGWDCVGTLQYEPEGETVASNGVSEKVSVIYSEIAQIIWNLRKRPLGLNLSENTVFHISTGGFQIKTALLWNDG